MQASLLNCIGSFCIEAHSVRIFFATDIGCYCSFKLRLTKLFEYSSTEQIIVERSRAEADDRVLVRAFEALLKSTRDPKRQEAQNSASLLKARQLLPLPLKDRNNAWMKRISFLNGKMLTTARANLTSFPDRGVPRQSPACSNCCPSGRCTAR